MTPHDQYSSSVGVLGCKINTNRVAYWPGMPDCSNICVKVSYQGRSVNLLRIDQSGGAHDISYDAWNYLAFGKSAKEEPHMGGGITMQFEDVPAAECKHLLDDGKLPLQAAGSMPFLVSCLAQKDSWVAKNHQLYNIATATCTLGHDEKCSFTGNNGANQPMCPHMLNDPAKLNQAVVNIAYGTGKEVAALQ
ncbi:uncharacterized protein UV8b_07670 [Ustilaginoidea virens]|nr:uncharacterized protein UV8b_07670 [Ustilaginoidea virens]QUC23429.1 hypothetical protein UV8b_07670 [Ustilaginoidea virens]